ncbi:glycosyltransferase [uncultured Rhodoblastus sp.]|uniref:glycosyltransferase n=1 Tax=uncultured Rhodoblastus sp. TaxID=543037 RepID=UPI0025E0F2EA|nr:glycosyltransferase [uncultured Rhodoblastus sp.]
MLQTSSQWQAGAEKAPSSSKGDDAFVSIILPHYNDLDNLKVCIALLEKQSFPRDRFEIIVAENNSACGMDAVIEACGPGVRVIHAALQGAAEARNAAVRESRGAILAFIDSDCRPEADWLRNGVAALAKADLVGGRVDVDVADPAHPTAVEAFEKIFAFNYRRYIEKEGYAVTANMFAPRAVFDRVGGFRAGYAEDLDWGKRAGKMGYSWVCAAEAGVSHPARRNWSELTRKWRRLAKESFVGMQEKSGWRLRWIVRTLALPASAFAHVPQALAYDGEKGLQFKLKAIAILFAIRFWRFREGFRLLLG